MEGSGSAPYSTQLSFVHFQQRFQDILCFVNPLMKSPWVSGVNLTVTSFFKMLLGSHVLLLIHYMPLLLLLIPCVVTAFTVMKAYHVDITLFPCTGEKKLATMYL